MRSLFDRFMAAVHARMMRAVRQIERMNLGVENLTATIEGKFITLRGVAPSREVASRVMELFKRMVGADNILNNIKIADPRLHNHQH
jgi:hypothetical protein